MNLNETLTLSLGNLFGLYSKAHGMHWNVEGPNFSEYHSFFGEIYEMAFSEVDDLAEQIRVTGSYVPYGTSVFGKIDHLPDIQKFGVDTKGMISDLLLFNNIVIHSLESAFEASEQEKQYGLSNFLADLIDKHRKLDWKLKSFSK